MSTSPSPTRNKSHAMRGDTSTGRDKPITDGHKKKVTLMVRFDLVICRSFLILVANIYLLRDELKKKRHI